MHHFDQEGPKGVSSIWLLCPKMQMVINLQKLGSEVSGSLKLGINLHPDMVKKGPAV